MTIRKLEISYKSKRQSIREHEHKYIFLSVSKPGQWKQKLQSNNVLLFGESSFRDVYFKLEKRYSLAGSPFGSLSFSFYRKSVSRDEKKKIHFLFSLTLQAKNLICTKSEALPFWRVEVECDSIAECNGKGKNNSKNSIPFATKDIKISSEVFRFFWFLVFQNLTNKNRTFTSKIEVIVSAWIFFFTVGETDGRGRLG